VQGVCKVTECETVHADTWTMIDWTHKLCMPCQLYTKSLSLRQYMHKHLQMDESDTQLLHAL